MNFGEPLPVDLAAIEQELTSLWKTVSGREGETAVVRACSCTLILIAQDRQEAEASIPILGSVAEWHPARILIAYREPGADNAAHPDAPHMHGWISAHCAIPVAGSPQIYSECIILAAYGKAADDLPNTLASLLVPDLQVYVYWRSFKASDHKLAERLARFSHLLIVDSHASSDDPENRHRLLELLSNPPGNVAVRDLNWSRLTAWRDLIAQFFDAPTSRHLAYEISEVEISQATATKDSMPTRTLLMTGWLASRLNWRRLSLERTGEEWISHWNSRTGEVVVRFVNSASESDAVAGLRAISLRTRSGPTLSVIREQGSPFLTATASGRGADLVHAVSQESLDEAALLVQELAIMGEDVGYRRALTEASALDKSIR